MVARVSTWGSRQQSIGSIVTRNGQPAANRPNSRVFSPHPTMSRHGAQLTYTHLWEVCHTLGHTNHLTAVGDAALPREISGIPKLEWRESKHFGVLFVCTNMGARYG